MNNVRLYMGILAIWPLNVVFWLLYILPLWALGWYRFHGVASADPAKSPLGKALVWVVADGSPAWLKRVWGPWGGQCLGSLIVLRKSPEAAPVTLAHELHHAHQFHTYGLLYPTLYYLGSLVSWAACEDSYSANPFESSARRVAGQVVDAKSFAQGYLFCKNGGKK